MYVYFASILHCNCLLIHYGLISAKKSGTNVFWTKHCTAVSALVIKVESNDDANKAGSSSADGGVDGSLGEVKWVSNICVMILSYLIS